MRVYLPATLSRLVAALADGPVHQFPPGTGYAVIPSLREAYASDDTEELEYAAYCLAAEASVALIAADTNAARRRVVVALEVTDPTAVVAADRSGCASRLLPGRVTLVRPVPLGWVSAVHVDGAEAVAAVKAAVADPADDVAAGAAADHELLWYATQELAELAAELPPGRQ